MDSKSDKVATGQQKLDVQVKKKKKSSYIVKFLTFYPVLPWASISARELHAWLVFDIWKVKSPRNTYISMLIAIILFFS